MSNHSEASLKGSKKAAVPTKATAPKHAVWKSSSSLSEIKERVAKTKRNGLSEMEVKALAENEKAIEQAGNQQVISAEAFKAIRDQKLWKGEHKSFRGYVKKRWPYEKSRLFQLTRFADFRGELREAMTAEDKSLKPDEVENQLPVNESQVRCLFKLKEPAQRVSVWMSLLDRSKPKEITGSSARQLMGEMYPETIAAKPAKEERNVEQEEKETDPINFEIKIEDGVSTVNMMKKPGVRFSGTLRVCVCSYAELERFFEALKSAEVRGQILELQKETME